jgi:trimeric autotransporter adhesin
LKLPQLAGRRRGPASRTLGAAVAACAVVGAFVTAASAAQAAPAASPAPSATVDSGSGWSVTQGAGGYAVRVTLPAALPTTDDNPVLVADGTVLGPATESASGRTLSLTTTDPAVAHAKNITWQWSAGSAPAAGGAGSGVTGTGPGARATATAPAAGRTGHAAGPVLGSDPATPGPHPYKTAVYDFGTQAIALANIGGVRGEVQGKIYLPTAGGPHPLVLFMHGRHATCYNTTTDASANIWPCPAGDAEIPSFEGYDGAGDALASRGYTVVSISANAINANDNQHAPDDGAVARGQLILDTLSWLQRADEGLPVSFYDAATARTVTLDEALAGTRITARDLAGSMNFSDIGIMGHSRGGEGAATAAVLNEGLAHPWDIKSVFMLAPIDFTRTTVPDVITTTLLPYCDGDVSDQQGQHFYADSRSAFGDSVLRSDIWVMGADHDFFNTYWTPPFPGAADDWTTGGQSASDPVCGLNAPATTRLSTTQEYSVGTAYVAGFFELTLGGQQQYLPMFDGAGAEPPSVASFADVRTVAQEPAGQRSDITSFATASPAVTASGSMTATICADQSGRTVPLPLPPCATGLTNQQVPYWTPANYAPNVPLNQMTHLTWTDGTAALRVTLPAGQRDVSRYQELTVGMSPDASVTTGTDMTLSVSDGRGHSYRTPVSALNKWAVTRMPSSTSKLLGKIVLQQVHLPTAALAAAGLDLRDITSVTFTAAAGTDGTPSGGEYLQDLTFDNRALGTPSVHSRPTVNVASVNVQESTGPSASQVAVYLSRPASETVTTYLTVIGSAAGEVGLAMDPVTFRPGQTCAAESVPMTGSTAPSATPTTAYKIAVSDPGNAVLGDDDFGTVTVAANAVTSGTVAPPDGVEGNPCAELAALSHPGRLHVDGGGRVRPGDTVTVTGTGFRAGESVAFSLGSAATGSAIAGADGTVSFPVTIPAGQAAGPVTISGVGAGSGYTSTASVLVR